jgi:hypothetical protein
MKALNEFFKLLFIVVILVVVVYALLFFWPVVFNKHLLYTPEQVEVLLTSQKNDFDSIIGEANNKLYSQDALILTQKQAIDGLEINIKDLKKAGIDHVEYIVKLEEKIEYLNVIADYDEPPTIVYIHDKIDSTAYMKVPISFYYKDTYLNILGEVRPENTFFDNISVKSYPTLVLGYNKDGYSAVITNTNPYIAPITINSVKVPDKPKKWYQRDILKIAGSFIGGVIIGKL